MNLTGLKLLPKKIMKPYYASDIDETIGNVDEDRVYRAMMSRDIDQIEAYSANIDVQAIMNPHMRSDRLYQFTQKCIEVRREQLTEEDTQPQPQRQTQYAAPAQAMPSPSGSGFWNPLTSVMGFIAAGAAGAYAGDKMSEWTGQKLDQNEIDRLMGK